MVTYITIFSVVKKKNHIRDYHMGYKQTYRNYSREVSCMTLSKFINLSVPPFVDLKTQLTVTPSSWVVVRVEMSSYG